MPQRIGKRETQREWFPLGFPAPRKLITAIDKAAALESVKLGTGPILRANFCRMVLQQDSRVQAAMNGSKKATR